MTGRVKTFLGLFRRKKRRRRKSKAKKTEFSKKLAVWASCIATAAVISSYALAAFEKDAASDVTTSVFTACIGYLITYAGKSLGEKMSRNKHHLDADGNPILDEPPAPDDEIHTDQ